MHGQTTPEGVAEQHASGAFTVARAEASTQSRGPRLEPAGGRRIDVLGQHAHRFAGTGVPGQSRREVGPHDGRLEGSVQAVQVDHANFLGRGW